MLQDEIDEVEIDNEKLKRMKLQIINEEKQNLKTRERNSSEMSALVRGIIEKIVNE